MQLVCLSDKTKEGSFEGAPKRQKSNFEQSPASAVRGSKRNIPLTHRNISSSSTLVTPVVVSLLGRRATITAPEMIII